MADAERRGLTLEDSPIHMGPRIVSFMGPEGAGKSTVARRLAHAAGKPYISTGDMLREMANHDTTPLGDECREMFAEHRYLNPATLLEILYTRFTQPDLDNGFILDGGIRTVPEIKGLQSTLERAGRNMPFSVIHLRIPMWMGMQRLVLSENARGRADDTINGVLSRFSHYYSNLGERASLIRNQPGWQLFHVNAMGSADDTFAEVRAFFETSEIESA